MYQLPSSDYSSQPSTSRPTVVPRFGVLIAIWFLLAAGYGGYRFLISRTKSTPEENTAIAAKPQEDVYRVALSETRAINAATDMARTQTEIRQAEAEVRRTLTLTDSFVEARHLHAALAKLEAAHQGLERARTDLDSLQLILKGENHQ